MSDFGPLRTAMQAAAKVTEFTLLLVLALALGSWLDGRLGTDPWLFLLGIVAGATAGLIRLHLGLTKLLDDDDPADPPAP